MNDLIVLHYLKCYVKRCHFSRAQLGCNGKEVGPVSNSLAFDNKLLHMNISAGVGAQVPQFFKFNQLSLSNNNKNKITSKCWGVNVCQAFKAINQKITWDRRTSLYVPISLKAMVNLVITGPALANRCSINNLNKQT
jgi:hypothetical protein